MQAYDEYQEYLASLLVRRRQHRVQIAEQEGGRKEEAENGEDIVQDRDG